MDEWYRTTLGDLCAVGICELQTGPFGSQLHAHDYLPDGVAVVPTEAIRARRIDHSVLPRIAEEKATSLARHRLQSGDILFARRGVQATGHIGVIREAESGFICGTGAIRLRVESRNDKINTEFLSHLLADPAAIEWFKFHAIGATMPNLNEGIIRSFSVLLPPLREQREIARVLSALDDKIDLNRRMNETLEAMARALFKDWFVDFGPTRAKQEGMEPYLAPDLWSLFPERLDVEGKPEGWQAFLLEHIAEHCKGTVCPSDRPDNLFEHYSLPAFDKGQNPAMDLGQTIKSNKTPVPKGAVLLSKLNPEIPRVWLPDDLTDTPQIASTEFLVFLPKAPSGRATLYCLFRDAGFKRMLEGMVTGTSKSHQRISPPALLKRRVLCGSNSALAALESVLAPALSRLRSNRAESRTLAQTRDLLLPKLMSGEIRVEDAEKTMEAHL
ncbi:restriction endonuclease subunit S [Candidatus Thiodictyon syntrophicum]|jgi:type I restriction enzyme S subunit|uniref:Type I restriction modification DNA specificity domain-containing protein n=1 Tax=Candidatus Thiodictyon syntrophicum TaxID=1166950 RepID=A0A2K8U4F1_9GAMM|nr:restriction endonuclease subunit S [Candidatus Thiodictyon syntrophicum]AUB80463.1 hypothetical protein THSYN_05545 [Candidatus Thiodictyon syntrophicum]